MNNQNPNSCFIEIPNIIRVNKNRCVKLVLNTVATEASSCFVLINGMFDEAQVCRRNNSRHLPAELGFREELDSTEGCLHVC